ncbi:hypothetical protein KM043_017088, partial [Ampulex compressa]
MRRAMIAMNMTWSIGEKIFSDNYERRMKMFRAPAGSVALYGAEFWGWEYEKRLDCLQRKYVKWILGLDGGTPNYIVVEETKMKELRIEAIKRVVRWYEKIVAEGVPLYLQGKRKRAERRLIARFRCGDEARGNQYWGDMEDRICRVCGKDIEDMDHIARECVGTKEDWAVEELLKEDGSGWEAMRRI